MESVKVKGVYAQCTKAIEDIAEGDIIIYRFVPARAGFSWYKVYKGNTRYAIKELVFLTHFAFVDALAKIPIVHAEPMVMPLVDPMQQPHISNKQIVDAINQSFINQNSFNMKGGNH